MKIGKKRRELHLDEQRLVGNGSCVRSHRPSQFHTVRMVRERNSPRRTVPRVPINGFLFTLSEAEGNITSPVEQFPSSHLWSLIHTVGDPRQGLGGGQQRRAGGGLMLCAQVHSLILSSRGGGGGLGTRFPSKSTRGRVPVLGLFCIRLFPLFPLRLPFLPFLLLSHFFTNCFFLPSYASALFRLVGVTWPQAVDNFFTVPLDYGKKCGCVESNIWNILYPFFIVNALHDFEKLGESFALFLVYVLSSDYK